MATSERNPRSRLMGLLRYTPVPLFLACLAGGVLMAGSAGIQDRAPRADGFVVLADKGSPHVVRIDLPPGWRAEYHRHTAGLFNPEGAFLGVASPASPRLFDDALQSSRPYASHEEYVRELTRRGDTVDERLTASGLVAVSRGREARGFSNRWNLPGGAEARPVTFYAHDGPSLTFLPWADAEPEAFRLFQTAEVLARDDPRADHLAVDEDAHGRKRAFWAIGETLLVLGLILLLIVAPYFAVYLEVVEASRGLPGLRRIDGPGLTPEQAAELEALRTALAGLGFREDGWFSLDNFDETHVGSWRHEEYSAVAFVLFNPLSGAFRFRFVRRFADGRVLFTSTRILDLAYPPPPGVHAQVRNPATVEQLWGWHLDGEKLFPAGGTRCEPVELYVEVARRWGRHRRDDSTWLLGVEPIGECWRMYWWRDVSLRRQVERGWTTLA